MTTSLLKQTYIKSTHNLSPICSYVLKRHLFNAQTISYTSTKTISLQQKRVSSQSNIDEFRQREEQRDAEYERQQENKKHQEEEETKRAKLTEIREKILESALPHVAELGWSREAIVCGAESAGFPSVVHGMFPEGGFALVSYFYGKCNEQLVNQMRQDTRQGQQKPPDVVEFVNRAIRSRLEMLVPYKSQWPQAIALMAAPQNASTALAQVLTLVDDICYYSGDRSVDITWYTRRIGVATIMKLTELFMIQDKSPNHERTWEFLKARLDEAILLQNLLAQPKDVTRKVSTSFNSAFETARNILGIGYQRR